MPKKKIDQNKDGKNDFLDVKIARMKASGMTLNDIKKEFPDLFEEADSKHPSQYRPDKKSIRGMTRARALEKTQEELKKADKLEKEGKKKEAEKLRQKAYDRRESMEKAEREKEGFKSRKSKYTEGDKKYQMKLPSGLVSDLSFSVNENIDEVVILEAIFKELILEKKFSAATKKALQNKAEKHNAPYGALKAVYQKGLGAYYSSGSRPGMGPQQWAMARVNSFLKGGKARKVDATQWEQVKGHRKKKKGKKK
jgi:hypothetical protein